ncbi:MAG: nucleotide exchange factor GrpE [Bacteroidales bacterium]|nr:nucleotide exchange factor GrpE [Bacteroidales bacterium]
MENEIKITDNIEMESKENLTDEQAAGNHETAKDKSEKKKVAKKHKKVKGRKDNDSNEKELQEKIDELNDKYLRLFSEFDNYRKRTIKEKIDLIKTASSEVITDLLPVLDDFERAKKSLNDSNDCKAIIEGIDLIYNKFNSILEKKGLKQMETIGKEFDTDFHEAITYIPAPEKNMKGKIVDEIEKGYLLNDKVIRFAKVVIGK